MVDSLALELVEFLLNTVRAYLFAGLVFAAPFLLFGVQRIDPDAKRGSIGFRLIIIPGICLFWPLLAVRWVTGKQRPVEENAHRLAAIHSTATPE